MGMVVMVMPSMVIVVVSLMGAVVVMIVPGMVIVFVVMVVSAVVVMIVPVVVIVFVVMVVGAVIVVVVPVVMIVGAVVVAWLGAIGRTRTLHIRTLVRWAQLCDSLAVIDFSCWDKGEMREVSPADLSSNGGTQ